MLRRAPECIELISRSEGISVTVFRTSVVLLEISHENFKVSDTPTLALDVVIL